MAGLKHGAAIGRLQETLDALRDKADEARVRCEYAARERDRMEAECRQLYDAIEVLKRASASER